MSGASHSPRTAWMSWLRGVSIIAVMVIHSTGSTAAAPGASTSTTGALAILIDIGSHYAVPVFVMVSGALNLDPERYRGGRHFLRRRTARLVPAIVFWHLWYVGVRWVRGDRIEAEDIAHRIVVGELFTQLYFLWIVLGLSAITPLLMMLIKRWGRRGAAVLGGVAMVATMASVAFRLPTGDVENALLWWLPYVGYYLLGWVLREVRLRGPLLAVTTLATVALGLLLGWQWGFGDAPAWLDVAAPVGYYGGGMALYSVLVYLVAHGLLAPDGVLARLTQPPLVGVGETLGASTLGVFGFHMTVIAAMDMTDLLGVDEPAPDMANLLLRVAIVIAVSYAVVLPLRKVPVVRAVL